MRRKKRRACVILVSVVKTSKQRFSSEIGHVLFLWGKDVPLQISEVTTELIHRTDSLAIGEARGLAIAHLWGTEFFGGVEINENPIDCLEEEEAVFLVGVLLADLVSDGDWFGEGPAIDELEKGSHVVERITVDPEFLHKRTDVLFSFFIFGEFEGNVATRGFVVLPVSAVAGQLSIFLHDSGFVAAPVLSALEAGKVLLPLGLDRLPSVPKEEKITSDLQRMLRVNHRVL